MGTELADADAYFAVKDAQRQRTADRILLVAVALGFLSGGGMATLAIYAAVTGTAEAWWSQFGYGLMVVAFMLGLLDRNRTMRTARGHYQAVRALVARPGA